MRICHVNEPGAGGSFGVLITLAFHQVRRGHEVHVIYSPDRADPRRVEQLRETGAAVHTSAMRRSVGRWDAADGLRLSQRLRSLGPLDVLHSHSSKAGVLARVFGRAPTTAQIYSPHGFYTMTGNAPFYVGAIERLLSHATDQIIAVSSYERDHAVALGIARQRVSVVPNGLRPSAPLSRAEARAALGLNPQAFVLGFVGRLEPQKDPLSAVRVLEALAGSGAELAIIGDGFLKAEVAALAASTGRPVHLLGAHNAMPLFSAFDLLLCTSRYEGMPVAFLESLNAGVPIVSYKVGGTDELIVDGRTGFVTEPAPEAAAAAVANLRDMPSEARLAMHRACLAMAARHTDAVMGEETLAVYRKAFRSGAVRRRQRPSEPPSPSAK